MSVSRSTSSPLSSAGVSLPDGSMTRLVRPVLLLLFSYIFLANSWLGDDAHITFRSVWNFVHGYGLTFNPDERVQAYTDPLWMLIVAAAHFVTREFYFTVTALSWAFCVAAGWIVLRRTRTIGAAVLVVLWLLSSKALVDYTSSGLEYPLAYFLIALFYVPYLERPYREPPTERELRYFVLIGALAFVTRVDMAVLFVVPIAELGWRAWRFHGRAVARPILIGAAPAVAWFAFATFYYGFPLPNTYYAKVANGVPAWLQHQQGFAYLFNSISHDPITLGTVALCALIAWPTRGAPRLAALSAVMYVAYTVSVGGDFMSGRFFAMPFLIAAITLAGDIESMLVPAASAAIVLYNLLIPIVPIKTTSTYDGAWPWRSQNGIKDERGHSHQGSNLLKYSALHPVPDLPFGQEGLSFAAADEHARVYCCIGVFGFNAGPAKYVLDENALADPLLARLPVSPRLYFDFWTSHYFRDLPEGYLESAERNENLLTDPVLHEFYDRLRNVTRGSLFRWSRLPDIWRLNLGYRSLHEEYRKRRPVALSIPANHPRFLTDVGRRDDGTSAMRSSGRAGYLQYGPSIPLDPGFYRARWIASVDEAANGDAGFVEVWVDGERIERATVRITAALPAEHARIAQVDFSLKHAARQVDYRFYVHGGVRLALERVELFSGLAIPKDSQAP